MDQIIRLELVPGESIDLIPEDAEVLFHYDAKGPDGRYCVQLPRKDLPLPLGESRTMAVKMYQQTLQCKRTWKDFKEGVQEYLDLDHAEPVPEEDLQKPSSDVCYLFMHGVVKESLATTKLRVVFDASAASSMGVSYNTVLVGPSLYPAIWFRIHTVALYSDMSKMFREIGQQVPR